jgi:two-component system, NarL family, response regulator NreC
VRVVIADDHPVVRAGLSALLRDQRDLELVGETGDGLDALALVSSLRPDVLLLDLMLPGMSGFEVAHRVATEHASTRVLVLTLHANDHYAARVIAEGAAGFVLKDAHPDAILRALRTVGAGGQHFPARLGSADTRRDAREPWWSLTDREREVALLVGDGLSSADVGERLGISPRTVEVHRGNVLRKLRLSGTTELVRFLIRHGHLSAAD